MDEAGRRGDSEALSMINPLFVQVAGDGGERHLRELAFIDTLVFDVCFCLELGLA